MLKSKLDSLLDLTKDKLLNLTEELSKITYVSLLGEDICVLDMSIPDRESSIMILTMMVEKEELSENKFQGKTHQQWLDIFKKVELYQKLLDLLKKIDSDMNLLTEDVEKGFELLELKPDDYSDKAFDEEELLKNNSCEIAIKANAALKRGEFVRIVETSEGLCLMEVTEKGYNAPANILIDIIENILLNINDDEFKKHVYKYLKKVS